jgi:hypothetical protein
MKVELRFRNTDQGDTIAYLRTAGAAPDGGQAVRSEDDYEHLVKGVMGARNRRREILITSSMENARTVALLRRGDSLGEALITELADNVYAVGLTTRDGAYDDGMPLIYDLREVGRPLELLGDFQPLNDIHVEVANGPLELITADPCEPGIEVTQIDEDELDMAM